MNILLLMPDALRSSQMHCCGYEKDTTPFIDRLASEGVLFTQAISQSSHTYPGITSTYTGLYPFTHGIQGARDYARVRESLADDLRSRPGFEKWELPLQILNRLGYQVIGKYGKDFCRPLGCFIDIRDLPPVPELLREYTSTRFFIMNMPYFTHVPYQAVPPYDALFLPRGYTITENLEQYQEVIRRKKWGRVYNPEKASTGYEVFEFERFEPFTFSADDRPGLVAWYDGAVRTFDAEVEACVTRLEELGLLEDTLIIITSDHGEEILERGSLGHASCSLAGTLYEENIRIPLIFHYPKALPGGRVIGTQVSQINIMPTLFDLLGLPVPPGTEGRSLLPLINGEETEFEEETYLEAPVCGWQAVPEDDGRMLWAMRTPQWKCIYNYDCKNMRGSFELYDLQNDPHERKNLYGQNTGQSKALEEKLMRKISSRIRSFQDQYSAV
ncbi:MAG: sulfatase [Planctomycetota bacterium]